MRTLVSIVIMYAKDTKLLARVYSNGLRRDCVETLFYVSELQISAAVMMISTLSTNRASPQALAGANPFGNQASQTSFIAAKSMKV